VYNAPVLLGSGAKVVQLIKNESDITKLQNINADYIVQIQDTTDVLSWDSIINNTNGATQYKLENASIHANNIVSVNNVSVKGDVVVYVDVPADLDIVLFTNFSSTGTVNIVPTNLDALHLMDKYTVGGDMHIRAIRSNDYARALNNNMGVFLNDLRNVAPDDTLLLRLDATNSLEDFNGIMSQSVRLYPIRMMQSIKTIYSHKMLETMHIAHDYGLGVQPITIFSGNMRTIGFEPYLNVNIDDDFHLKIFGNVFNIKYSDDMNSYDAISYGLGADLVYSLPSDNFIRTYGGLNLSSFDSGLVFDGNGGTMNPSGCSGYFVGEFGHKFNLDKYYITPFVMGGGEYATLLNTDDLDYYLGIGTDTGFHFVFDGFRYDYIARAMLRSDGGVGADIKISIWSLMDSAGAGLRGGIFYDDLLGASYHVALDTKFNF
jgi:hypothetical protein